MTTADVNESLRLFDSEALLELVATGATDVELRPVFQPQRIIAAGPVEQRVDAIEPHNR